MNWYQQNRWLGNFLIIFVICTLGAVFFLFHARGAWDEAVARFDAAANERKRLENLDPFPNEQNFRKVKAYLDEYGSSLEKLKAELKNRSLPAPPLAPNEFQSHLRQSMLALAEKARGARVKLPDNFALGFDEYTAALPNTVAAPLLGQELSQIELLTDILIEAHVDEVTSLTRAPLPEEGAAAPAPTSAGARKPAGPAGGAPPKLLERSVVDVSFRAAPSAARKVLNQISSSSQQLFIARTIYVHDEKDKGPAREQPAAAGSVANATAAAPKAPSNTAISFIVGNEHIEASARIEMLRFAF
jgi:hypothetical protein